MAMTPIVPEIRMADVGKLISLENLLVRKVTWLVLTTMSATLILSHAFGDDCMTYCLHIPTSSKKSRSYISTWQRSRTLSHSLHFDLQRQHTLFLTFYLQHSIPWKSIHSATFFSLVLPFRLDLLQPRTQLQKIRQPAWKKTWSSLDTLLYFYVSMPYKKYLVHIHFIVYKTLSIFSLFP